MINTAHATAEATGLDGAARQNQEPGRLRGDIGLTVQTRFAQRVIVGRQATADKPAIIGLLGFADRLRVIWHAAYADDPYADWWLIKVHAALEYARTVIDDERDSMQRVTQSSGLEIGASASARPYHLALKFATPYAYRAAQLIATFDCAACATLTAKYTGLLSGADAERRLQRCTALLRGLFGVSQAYRLLRIDRATVAAGGTAAKQAAELMGGLPPAVLSGEQVAPWHPGSSKSAHAAQEPATPTLTENGR